MKKADRTVGLMELTVDQSFSGNMSMLALFLVEIIMLIVITPKGTGLDPK